jgi:purine-cytosine permease-like protein
MNKYLSRSFIIIIIILFLNLYCFIFNKEQFTQALTVLDGAVTAWVSFGSYFKEKNYKL